MSNNETIINYNYWRELTPELKKCVSKFIAKFIDLYGLSTQIRYAKMEFSYDPPRLLEDGYKNDWKEDRLYCTHPSCNNFNFSISEDAITIPDRELVILTILTEHINFFHLDDLVQLQGEIK